MKLKLLCYFRTKIQEKSTKYKIYPREGRLLDFKNGELHVLTWGMKFGVGKICLKSREGEVIRATVFLYLYELIFSHKFSND